MPSAAPTSPPPRHWTVVVNPVSGRGRAGRYARRLEAEMARSGVPARFVATRGPMHAAELAAAAVATGGRHIAALGGDGTANEVVDGLMRQSAASPDTLTVATLPVGTGNDWARSLAMPRSPRAAAALLAAGGTVRCDVGRLHYRAGGRDADRFFVNVAGAGFDAFVLERLGTRKPGAWAYLLELLRGMRRYDAQPLRLGHSEGERARHALVVFAGLGRYCGGGMQVAPRASLDDGLLDVTVVGDMSGMQVLVEMRRLFDASIHESRHIDTWQASRLTIESDAPVGVEADGELLGTLPARIEILPRTLAVIAGPDAAGELLPLRAPAR